MKNLLTYWQQVSTLLEDDKKRLPAMGLFFVLASILDVIGIGLIAPYVALIVSPNSFEDGVVSSFLSTIGLSLELYQVILLFGCLLALIFFFKAVSAILINRSILRYCLTRSYRLRASLMRSYQSLPYAEYLQRNSSEYIHNINLADKFATSSLQALLRLISDGVVALVIIIFLATQSPSTLLLLTVLLGSMVFFYDRYFRKIINVYGQKANSSSTEMLRGVNEGIQGLKEIRTLGKEEYFYSKMYQGAKAYSSVVVSSSMISTSPRYLLEFLMVIFVVMLVFIAIVSGQNISEMIPTLSMFGMASIRLVPATNQMLGGLSRLRFGRHGIELLYKDLRRIKSREDDDRLDLSQIEPELVTSLILEKVTYTYPNMNKPALQGINLKLEAGEAIGIMGPSGAGKTTLIDVLLGLLLPQAGEIFYNGKVLNSNNLTQWRRQIAYLPQEVFLIDDTVKKNIALGSMEEEIDIKKLMEAIKQARLSELVDNLPHGVETMLGERGIRISGGQKQRIALARTFYYGRTVLVMDESTSALDNEMEKEIVDEISNLKGKKTLIVIAHRLNTLKHCDRILSLEDGQLTSINNVKTSEG